MIGGIEKDDKGNVTSLVSNYQPPRDIQELTTKIRKDYGIGYEILHRSFAEFNDKNLIKRMDIDQKAFNAYVGPQSADPAESWRWPGVRPVTRNKIIGIAAHFAVSTVIPGVFAQNDFDEEQKDAASVMRYLLEWNIRNSDYETSYMFGILAALVNPVAYLHAEFAEAMQTIKSVGPAGGVTTEEVVDNVLSGFHTHNVPADEILIANPYEFYLQRQRFIGRRRFDDYNNLAAKYKDHKYWDHVKPGVKAFYDEELGMFYDQKDDDLDTLAEEFIYYNRREDMEVSYVNGIYMGKDDVEANRIKHRDNENHPKYPYAKFGYEPIDEKNFYFYKSAAAKLGPDQDLVDEMYRMLMDVIYQEAEPAVAGIGVSQGQLNPDVTMPGSVSELPQDAKVVRVLPPKDVNAAVLGLREAERSMTETSQDAQRSGTEAGHKKTAFEVDTLERNARINLGIFGKMIVGVVGDYGDLTIDNIIHHQTVGAVGDILGSELTMKYRAFLLPDQMEKGKKMTRKIVFDKDLIGKQLSDKQLKKERYKLLKKVGGKDADTILYLVNPEKFSKLKFKMIIDWEELMPKYRRYEEAKKIEGYQLMKENPLADLWAVSRDFLFEPLAKGESDKYMKKLEEAGIQGGLMLPPGGAKTPNISQMAKQGIKEGVLQ